MPVPTKESKPWIRPIREVRKHYNWTQAQMAENLAVGQTAVSRWEAGDREPSRQTYEELYMLAHDLPVAPFFWERARLSQSRLEYLLKGVEYRVKHPTPELKTEVIAGEGTYKYVNSWARLIPTPPPVALPLLKEAGAVSDPQVSADQVEEVLFFSSHLVPHPEATRCVSGSLGLFPPSVLERHIIVVDTFEKSPAKLGNALVVVRSPGDELQVKWVRPFGTGHILVSHQALFGYTPTPLDKKSGWKIVGKVLFWIGQPISK